MCSLANRVTLFFALFLLGFYGNMVAGEKTQNYRGWPSHSDSNAVSYAPLQHDSQYVSEGIINWTTAASGPTLSINDKFSRPELVDYVSISGDISTRRQWFLGSQWKASEGYWCAVSGKIGSENHGVNLHGNLLDCFACGKIKCVINGTIGELEPPNIERNDISLPSTLWNINPHFALLNLSEQSRPTHALLQVSDDVCRGYKITLFIYEHPCTVDEHIDLSKDILLYAQNWNDGIFERTDGLNKSIIRLREKWSQGQGKEKQKQKDAGGSVTAKKNPASPTSGVLTLRNDGQMYGCFIAESSASELNIVCPQIDSPLKREVAPPSTQNH